MSKVEEVVELPELIVSLEDVLAAFTGKDIDVFDENNPLTGRGDAQGVYLHVLGKDATADRNYAVPSGKKRLVKAHLEKLFPDLLGHPNVKAIQDGHPKQADAQLVADLKKIHRKKLRVSCLPIDPTLTVKIEHVLAAFTGKEVEILDKKRVVIGHGDAQSVYLHVLGKDTTDDRRYIVTDDEKRLVRAHLEKLFPDVLGHSNVQAIQDSSKKKADAKLVAELKKEYGAELTISCLPTASIAAPPVAEKPATPVAAAAPARPQAGGGGKGKKRNRDRAPA